MRKGESAVRWCALAAVLTLLAACSAPAATPSSSSEPLAVATYTPVPKPAATLDPAAPCQE